MGYHGDILNVENAAIHLQQKVALLGILHGSVAYLVNYMTIDAFIALVNPHRQHLRNIYTIAQAHIDNHGRYCRLG